MNDAASMGLEEAAAFWSVEHTVIVLPPNQVTTILKPNTRRWAFIVSSRTAAAKISPWAQTTPTGGEGYTVPAADPARQFNYRDHGGLVQVEWYASPTGPGETLDVVEVLWR